ncbi:hypothetical protein PV327_011599 [Microctonus hyperodae]|uniref:Uncharacterized protein n=1 Tax=Microctonus hyperodae TaxID=165561 RepID=A0AA39FH54_MICHY|nr:hypothetical protein PV327_011599 [Microctonus hyperodae]
MNTIKIYFSILLVMFLFCDSSPQEVELQNIVGAIGQILGAFENMDVTKICENSTSCRMSEKCILELCRNPCPGSCGINAICTVLEHEPKCRCPKCYEGDALVKCESYQGK